MSRPFTSKTTLVTLAFLALSPLPPTAHATPLALQTDAATAYTYTAISTLPAPTPQPTMSGASSCPTTIVTHEFDCPPSCVAAPVAGMLGIVEDKFECMTPMPVVEYEKYVATSTCEEGAVVTTFYPWGGERVEGCKKVGS